MKLINVEIYDDGLAGETTEVLGTSKLGELEDVTYEELVNVFKEPNSKGDQYKIDVEWILHTPVGIATIYNWKNGKNYNGEVGKNIEDITEWSIGGNDKRVVDFIKVILGDK